MLEMDMTPTEPSFYKDLLDRMSDGVFFVDQHRLIQYWNQGAFRLTGYEAQDVVGHYCHDGVLCHLDHTGHRLCDDACPLLATLNDGSLHEANIFLRHKQGRRVPVAVRVQPVRGRRGRRRGRANLQRRLGPPRGYAGPRRWRGWRSSTNLPRSPIAASWKCPYARP